MYRLSILQTISCILLLCLYPLASAIVSGAGLLDIVPLLAFMLAPAGGALLLMRARRFYAARLLTLVGLLPVLLVGAGIVYPLIGLAASGYIGLADRAMDAGIAALAAAATCGAVRGTLLTSSQMPRRPGIAAVLRGRAGTTRLIP